MKDALLKNPSILKQSFDHTIKPRVELLQFLQLAGFNVSASDYGPLLSMRNSEFTNELLLHNSWSPKQTVKNPSTAPNTNPQAAAVNEMMPTSMVISFSDEDNRDVANVVHWR